MQTRSYRNLYLLLLWFGLLLVAAGVQPSLPKIMQVFPGYTDVVPGYTTITNLIQKFTNKQEPQPDPKDEPTAPAIAESKDHLILDDGENHKRLIQFFSALDQLKENKRNHVRVIHFGDSLIWADNVAFQIKSNLQKEFGDGGRGIVTIVDSKESVLKGHKNLTRQEGEFKLFQVEHNSFDQPLVKELGFTAKSNLPLKPNAETIQEAPADAGSWTKARVLLRSLQPSEGSLKFTSGNDEIKTIPFQLNENDCKPFETDLPDVRNLKMAIDYNTNAPLIDALLLESKTGLNYSTVVRMGIHQAWMSGVSDSALECGYHWLKPDLVIFEFGVNESASIETRFMGYTKEKYETQLRNYTHRIRQVLPDTSILMIGPMDRVKSANGQLLPVAAQDEVRQIQKKIADEFDIAYFDTYQLLGGRGHIIQMVKQGLALNDYMHLSTAGGNVIADGVSKELLTAFNDATGKALTQTTDFSSADGLAGEDLGAISFNSRAYAVFLFFVLIVSSILVRWPNIRLGFLVFASLYFYASWKLWPLLLIIGSTLLDYFCGMAIANARSKSNKNGTVTDRGTRFLLISLIGNLGLLFLFKYLNFTGDVINRLIDAFGGGRPVPVFDLLLPVGISFYTFQTLSYTIDIWRGTLAVERNLLRFSLYVSFFPQLVAGPIVRAAEFLPDIGRKLRHFVVTHERFSMGLFLIFCGLLKKMVADWLGVTIVDRVYASPGMFTSAENLAAVYAYGIQIYGDFSGYTDMALGSAAMLGFHLTENFRRPYQAASVTEYWRRWHISLGSWIRDYIYIGLGGNRTGVARNLFITMFIAGLWHGAGLNYVVWGSLHGVVMILERYIGWGKNDPKTMSGRIARVAVTQHFILFALIIFRLDDAGTMKAVVDRIFLDSSWMLKNLDWRGITLVVFAYIFHLTPITWREKMGEFFTGLAWPVQSAIAVVVTVVAFQLALPDVQPFIYFQF